MACMLCVEVVSSAYLRLRSLTNRTCESRSYLLRNVGSPQPTPSLPFWHSAYASEGNINYLPKRRA